MLTRYTGIGLAAFSLAAMAFVAVPCVARAQDNGGQTSTGTENTRRISLDAESMNLYTALELLFREAKIQNYTLDPSLKQNVVTAHLHDIPFNAALDILLKNSGLPLTVEENNGVYSIVPKKELEQAPTPESTETTTTEQQQHIIKIPSSSLTYNAV